MDTTDFIVTVHLALKQFLYPHTNTVFEWAYMFMALNATVNNIPVISWRSVLLVEETGVLGKNHRSAVTDCFVLDLDRDFDHLLLHKY